jgi:DNA-binding transcriptional ArsR family regulator
MNPQTPPESEEPVNANKTPMHQKMLGALSWLNEVENHSLVELLGRYSNRANWTNLLERLNRYDQPKRPASSTRRRTVRRLRRNEADMLVRRYRSGTTVCELASLFKIHRTTVSAHLRRAGVKMRRLGLTDSQVMEAAVLYVQGWSLARIGRKLAVDGETVRKALRAQGVPMRSPGGRGSNKPVRRP